MCFSAQASFIASGVLATIGTLVLKKVIHKKRFTLVPFAIVPMLFALQQAIEGFVWIFATHSQYHEYLLPASYGFLFFAFFLWPIWIPFSLYSIETHAYRRNVLAVSLGIGATVSTGLAYLSWYFGIASSISCSHIAYAINLPEVPHAWALITYIFAPVMPFFISSKRKAHYFGILLIASILITLWFYCAWFTSVWCFFAALI